MAKLLFVNCCCCVDLRVGCFIIAYLGLIGTGLSTLKSVNLVLSVEATEESKSEFVGQRDVPVPVTETAAYSYTMLAINIISTLLCFVLLIGLHKGNPGLVKFYLTSNVIYLLISFVYSIITYYTHEIIMIIYITILSMTTYLLLVIRSYYYKMLDEHKKAI